MGRLQIPMPVKDSPEDMQKCFHCELDECVNCLTFAAKRDHLYEKYLKKQRAVKQGLKDNAFTGGRPIVFDDTDREIVKAYIKTDSMSGIATMIGASVTTVTYRIKKKLKLPSPRGLSEESKKALVRSCQKRF